MKSPLTISNTKIVNLIERFYSLIIEDLNFLPEGEDGAIYKFTSDKEKYIVKFIGIRAGDKSFDLNIHWKEIVTLSRNNSFDFLCLPIQSIKKDFVISDNGLSFAIFKFIQGDLWDRRKLNISEYENLGRVIAQLHNANTDKYVFQKDNLSLENIIKLENDLHFIEATENNSENIIRLRKIVLPWLRILYEGIVRIEKVKDQILIDAGHLVLTHGDLNPSNVFINGYLIKLIDCEGMILSYPEKDLNFFSDDNVFPSFLKGYRDIIKSDINIVALEYYKYKWDLESIGAWISSILGEVYTDEQLEHEYEFLQKDLEAYKLLQASIRSVRNNCNITE